MSTRVRIGGDERDLSEARDTDWIAHGVNRRLADGLRVCIEVVIHEPSCNVRLSTPGCSSRDGGRPPTDEEAVFIDLWCRHGLNREDYTVGNVLSFFQELRRLLR